MISNINSAIPAHQESVCVFEYVLFGMPTVSLHKETADSLYITILWKSILNCSHIYTAVTWEGN